MKWKVTSYEAEMKRLERELAAEREVGHNQAVTLGQHIARLEDQVAELQKKLQQYEPVQLPMINDDPVVTLK
jgi:hypothetical protein